MRLVKVFAIGASIISSVVEALPSRAQSFARRQVTELRDEYDFVIIGGGTAGLTVAHRVSAAFPKSEL
jgi:ribulose 1,5-bisphosphate synthetase/thiazole synthase